MKMILKQYFQAYNNYFWQWEEEGNIIAVPNGNTIAYWQRVNEILDKIHLQGLPRFGPFLLALAATSNNGVETIKGAIDTIRRRVEDERQKPELQSAEAFLNLLAKLPKAYKSGHLQIRLFLTLFRDSHNGLGIKNSQDIIIRIKLDDPKYRRTFNKLPLSSATLKRDLKTLALLGEKYPTINLILEAMLAVPTLEEEVELDSALPPDKARKDLIDELLEHPQTFMVGALVKRIWSGINIPFNNTIPSQQPFGGVADITNKGDFDKLLTSEFANDELVFLSRLANNEALYFNREIPPTKNDLERLILIDVSLKNWGNVRTIAFATMLAIAKHPKSELTCTPILLGDRYHTISIESVQDIMNALNILEGTLSPALGLEAFLKDTDLKQKELLLICHQDSYQDIALQQLISVNNWPVHYWIHPNREGLIQVYKAQNKSKKHIQNLKLPLAELWEPKKAPKKKDNGVEVRFPILFPVPKQKHLVVSQNDDIYMVNREKMLLRQHKSDMSNLIKGAELIYQELPFTSKSYCIGQNKQGDYILLGFRGQDRQLFLLNLTTYKLIETNFVEWRESSYANFVFFENYFYYLTPMHYWRIDMEGHIVRGQALPADLFQIYEVQNKKNRLASRRNSGHFQILKNVKSVCLNRFNQIVFNSHHLELNQQGTIKLKAKNLLPNQIELEALFVSKNKFEFPDGSKVEVNRSGMLILESSDQNLSKIYIPSVLDLPLGLATEEAFTGNKYFYKSKRFDIFLEDPGTRRLNLIKIMKQELGIGLRAAKDMVFELPRFIARGIPEDHAMRIRTELAATDATYKFYSTGEDLDILSGPAFYKQYIDQYISVIKNTNTKLA